MTTSLVTCCHLHLALVVTAVGCSGQAASPDYRVVQRFPHDTMAYTQGVLFSDGKIYESTGLYGRSQLRVWDLASGHLIASRNLPAARFGEGLALLEGRLYQLTWRSGLGYVYDVATLAVVDSFPYEGEGWGLTTDGTRLIMSDGTARLRLVDPVTYEVVQNLEVSDGGHPLSQINELEYVNGLVYANVYRSEWVVKIDLRTGAVMGRHNLRELWPSQDRRSTDDVLNGIAYDSVGRRLLVTGKRWPAMFHVELLDPEPTPAPGA